MDETTIPCMHCLYLRDWTCWDAAARTMIKHMQENMLFLEVTFRPCHACKPKRGIPNTPWMGLNEHYAKRGLTEYRPTVNTKKYISYLDIIRGK